MANKPEKPWDPWKMYDLSAKELRAIKERAKMREAMKAEWQKKLTDPHRGDHGDGHIFDPAVQRYMAMRSTHFEHFKVTPKTTWLGFIFVVFPIGFMTYYIKTQKATREAKFRAGEVKYKDRVWYFFY